MHLCLKLMSWKYCFRYTHMFIFTLVKHMGKVCFILTWQAEKLNVDFICYDVVISSEWHQQKVLLCGMWQLMAMQMWRVCLSDMGGFLIRKVMVIKELYGNNECYHTINVHFYCELHSKLHHNCQSLPLTITNDTLSKTDVHGISLFLLYHKLGTKSLIWNFLIL